MGNDKIVIQVGCGNGDWCKYNKYSCKMLEFPDSSNHCWCRVVAHHGLEHVLQSQNIIPRPAECKQLSAEYNKLAEKAAIYEDLCQ